MDGSEEGDAFHGVTLRGLGYPPDLGCIRSWARSTSRTCHGRNPTISSVSTSAQPAIGLARPSLQSLHRPGLCSLLPAVELARTDSVAPADIRHRGSPPEESGASPLPSTAASFSCPSIPPVSMYGRRPLAEGSPSLVQHGGLYDSFLTDSYLEKAGVKGAPVHSLRHTMATHHVAAGTDLKTVQATLGHASLATTAIYVQLSKSAQRRALQEHAL